jgi:uncharacterized protein HemY
MVKLAQGLECHANYWVKCAAGATGKWTVDVHHILITVVIAIVAIYVLFKLFRIIK